MENTHSVPDDIDDLRRMEEILSKIEVETRRISVSLESCLASSTDVKDAINRVYHMIPEIARLEMSVSDIESILITKPSSFLLIRKTSCSGLASKLKRQLSSMLTAIREWAERIQTIERREEIIKKLKGLSEEVKQKEKEFDIKYHG